MHNYVNFIGYLYDKHLLKTCNIQNQARMKILTVCFERLQKVVTLFLPRFEVLGSTIYGCNYIPKAVICIYFEFSTCFLRI